MQSPNNRLDQDHYKVLGVDYDATEDSIRTSYLRLALKWHPDKHNGASAATLKFQEISEAYRVLSDPLMRHEYDIQGNYGLQDYNYTSCGLVITIEGSVPGRKLKSEASLPHEGDGAERGIIEVFSLDASEFLQLYYVGFRQLHAEI